MSLINDLANIINLKKEHYYSLAHTYYNTCDKSDFQIIPSSAQNKSISLLVDHEFLETPLIQVQLSLFIEENLVCVGTFTLYTDESEGTIIEEYQVIL